MELLSHLEDSSIFVINIDGQGNLVRIYSIVIFEELICSLNISIISNLESEMSEGGI